MFMKKRIPINRIVWLFVIGCLIGFGVETLWHFAKNHVWINKQGLLYGPFKPIYGFGAALFTWFLYPYKDRSKWFLFFWGIVIGTTFEYIASLFQEICFGTYTWTYSHFKYSISSRIYLPYCVFWGVLALIWLKVVYPKLDSLIRKINPVVNTIWVIVFAVFMTINVTLTALATDRMAERARGIDASNVVERWIDKTYPDSIMQSKFPKMRVIKN